MEMGYDYYDAENNCFVHSKAKKMDAAIKRTMNYTLHDWIDISDCFSRYQCPKCFRRINGAKTNYCPNCGIPMRV